MDRSGSVLKLTYDRHGELVFANCSEWEYHVRFQGNSWITKVKYYNVGTWLACSKDQLSIAKDWQSWISFRSGYVYFICCII